MQVHFTDQGSGDPIVFIHGWCLNSDYWMYAESNFASSYRVICVDLPGFGRAQRPLAHYEFTDFADSVIELLSGLSLTNVMIVGFAFGAIVATEIAKRSPERIRAVCAIGIPDKDCMPYTRMPPAMKRDWPLFASKSAKSLLVKVKSPETERWLTDMFRSANLDWAIKTCLLMSSVSMADCVNGVNVPMLLIHSDVDLVSPPELMKLLIAEKDNMEIVVLEGVGHAIPIDATQEFHDALEYFMKGIACK